MSAALLLAALAGAARAGALVLHDRSSDDQALSEISELTGRKSSELEVMDIQALVGAAPARFIGGTALQVCEGSPTSPAALAGMLGELRSAVLYVDYERAMGLHSKMAAAIPCLSGPLDPALAAEAWLLLGYVLHEEGRADEAQAAFGQVGVFVPTFPWPDNLNPDFAPRYFQARDTSAAEVSVRVFPVPDSLMVDGVLVKGGALSLAAGLHVVQYGDKLDRVLAFEVAGADDLLIPAAASVASAASAAGGADELLSGLLALGLDPGTEVLVATNGRVFQGNVGERWSEVLPTGPSPVGRALTWSGAGLVVVGGATSAITYAIGRSAYDDMITAQDDATTAYDEASQRVVQGEFDDASGRFTVANRLLLVSNVATVGGALMLGGGLLLLDGGGVRLETAMTAGAPGVRLQW